MIGFKTDYLRNVKGTDKMTERTEVNTLEQDVVSVVVPIYKTEKYLDRCIESIVDQSYRNLEIILVDDGSPDNCPEMCDAWAAKDSRIKVVHKVNEGLSRARNTGIACATGTYICFFDSDDYVDPDTIKLAHDMAQKSQLDMVIFGMGIKNSREELIGEEVPVTPKQIYEGAEVQDVLLPEALGANAAIGKSYHIMFSACCVLFSFELIRRANWQFVSEKEIMSEDVYSLLTLYQYVQKVGILPERLYYYRENTSSISRSYRPDRFARNKHFYLQCVKLCEQIGYSNEVVVRCRHSFLCNAFAALKQVVAYHGNYQKAKDELRAIVDDTVFHQVVQEKRKDKENFNKRVFYWVARNKMYYLCYLLLVLKMK